MSDSPRKLIRRANDALSQLRDTLARHPAAAAELERALGAELLSALHSASAAVGAAHERLSAMRAEPHPVIARGPAPTARLLGVSANVAGRRAALERPHMRALVEFAESVRRVAPAPVADFDPFDGGVNVEILFLLEAPGPQTARTGFISRDNPDETAKAWLELNAEAGLPRERTATWNAVPWIVDGSPSADNLRAAQPHLRRALALFPRLRVLVLVGRKAAATIALATDLVPP